MAARKDKPVFFISICQNCQRKFQGTTRLCLNCDVTEQGRLKKAVEPTLDSNAYAYALEYGKQAVIEALKSRWCDQS